MHEHIDAALAKARAAMDPDAGSNDAEHEALAEAVELLERLRQPPVEPTPEEPSRHVVVDFVKTQDIVCTLDVDTSMWERLVGRPFEAASLTPSRLFEYISRHDEDPCDEHDVVDELINSSTIEVRP